MAFGMRRQFVAWMPARAQAGAVMMMMMICPPVEESDWHPCCFSDLTPSMYRQRGLSWSKQSQEYTHKYCLFLACLRAARVWSLLKSPESDFKMSSKRIPAFNLHMSLIVVLVNNVAIMNGCFCPCWKSVFLLTSSGSALRLIVFYMLMLSSVWTC